MGGAFIIAYRYFGYEPIIIRYWTATSFIACFFIVPIIAYIIRKCDRVHCRLIEMIGVASYDIYLVQKAYFPLFAEYIDDAVKSRALYYMLSLMICVCVGILFYYTETPITKWINRKVYSIMRF